MAQFSVTNPSLVRDWHNNSNYLVIVAVPDEDTLRELSLKALALGIPSAPVSEPDLDDQMTAIALAPGEKSGKLCANFPLALREMVPM